MTGSNPCWLRIFRAGRTAVRQIWIMEMRRDSMVPDMDSEGGAQQCARYGFRGGALLCAPPQDFVCICAAENYVCNGSSRVHRRPV